MNAQKTLTVLFLAIFINLNLFSIKANAQSSEAEIFTTGYRTDATINLIINYLPKGWTFSESNGNFIIQRSDSVWVLKTNTVNVKKEKKEARQERIVRDGLKTVAKIVIRYEDKWDFLKRQEANLHNSSVNSEIRKLPEKMGIQHLKDAKLSGKGNIVYTPVTEQDKIKIDNYYKERAKLEATLIRIPDHSTQKYSLFIISKIGCNDDSYFVFPSESSVELFGILNFINEVSGK
ncbi:MAG: hypothetical protein PHR81_03920 [Bacteroidales bacterium]|jgi:hypothetical protein|nr:hypothetical protein [Bacteroidales bacterium]